MCIKLPFGILQLFKPLPTMKGLQMIYYMTISASFEKTRKRKMRKNRKDQFEIMILMQNRITHLHRKICSIQRSGTCQVEFTKVFQLGT